MAETEARARRILKEINSNAWEHPADKAALASLRRIPVFDEVLRKLFGLFGEKPVRLAFQANAVRVGPRQFPEIHRRYIEVLATLDSPEEYPLLVSQTPIVNAGAYGMDHPFIILNSGSIRLLKGEELDFILGHELGHVLSGHVLYRTMTVLLLRLAEQGFPIIGLAARAVLIGLLEWSRKAELSSDRAGLLAVQSQDPALTAFMKLAGGGFVEETNLPDFLDQAEEYRHTGDLADSIFKVLNLLGATHPFAVLRTGELRDWIESGDYDRILGGDYKRRTDERTPWKEDLAAAGRAYREEARTLFDQFGEAARRFRDQMSEGLRR